MSSRRSALPVAAALVVLLTVALVAPAAGAGGTAQTDAGADDEYCTEATPPNTRVAVMTGPPAVATGNWSASRIQGAYHCTVQVQIAERVAMGDTLIVRLQAPGLRDAVAAQAGDTTTERFRALVASDDATLTAPQLAETVSPERAPMNLELLNGTRVLHSYDDTFLVVANASDLRATVDTSGDGTTSKKVASRQGYRITLEFDGHAANETVLFTRPEVGFSDLNAEHRLYRAPEAGQTFTGTTTLAPGQNVTLSFRDAETGELMLQADGETTMNLSDVRRFEATADLSSMEQGSNLTVTVRSEDGRVLEEGVPLRIRETNAAVAAEAADADGEYGAVEATGTLSHGGFLVLHEGGPDGPMLDSDGFLAGGPVEERLHFEMPDGSAELTVVAYRDTDGDGAFDPDVDRPYDGADATATVAVGSDGRSNSTTTADDESSTPATTTADDGRTTTADGGNAETTGDDESAGGDMPGFDALGALAALVAGLTALGLRR